jgi:hypothetical protein
MTAEELVAEDIKQAFHKAIQQSFDEQYAKYIYRPDYYPKRKYGKWTIYKKDGSRVAWGLNEREMEAYMKLLKEE